MIITVFGATGMVGKQLVRHALANGHSVRAFGRNVADLIDKDLQNENLEAIKGSVFDSDDVYEAIIGCDAVLSALGGRADGVDKTRSLGMKTIIQQMEKAGLKRIVALGGLGVLDAGDGTFIMDKVGYPKEFLAVAKEHLDAFLQLKKSSLDWTFICPPNIKDADASGQFITSITYAPNPNQYYINAGDLAMFMVMEVVKNDYVQHRVGISQT